MNGHQPQRPAAPRPHPAQIKIAKQAAAAHEEKAAICKEIIGGLALLRAGLREWKEDPQTAVGFVANLIEGADQLVTALGRYTQSTERDHEEQATRIMEAVRSAESGIVTV